MRAWRLMVHHDPELQVQRYREYVTDGRVYLGWDIGGLLAEDFGDLGCPRMCGTEDCSDRQICGRERIYRFLMENYHLLIADNAWLGACSVWGFYHEMQTDDLIHLKTGRFAAEQLEGVLQVSGEYEHVAREDYPVHYPNRRSAVNINDPGPRRLYTKCGPLNRKWLYYHAPRELEGYLDGAGVHCALIPYTTGILQVGR